MKRHCAAVFCLGVIAVNAALPYINCVEHKDCHIHSDEPVKKAANITTVTSSSYLSNGTVSSTTTL